MLGYIVRRLGMALITIWAISLISFIIIQLPPGDYITAYIAQLETQGTAVLDEEAESLRIQYGLDKPFIVQYYKWLRMASRGNFGVAMEYNLPVLDVIGDRLALTALLTFVTIIFTWILAIPIGIYSAVRQYSVGGLLIHVYWVLRPGGSQLPAGPGSVVHWFRVVRLQCWWTVFA